MHRYRSLKSLNRYWRAVLTVAATFASSAHADNTDWQLHGALTQGVIYTSNNNFYGPSDDGVSLKFSEINLNASARLLPNLRAAGQLLYRHAGAQTEGGGLDYLFFDYQFFATKSFLGDLRTGRFKIPFGLYNETRDIALTRPSIYLPSAYPDIARDLQISGDGILVSGELLTNIGQWTGEIGAGKPRIDQKTIYSLFRFLPGEISNINARNSLAGRLMYQSGSGEWLAALSAVDVHFDYQLNTTLNVDVRFIYWLASLQYNLDQWTFTGEYGQMGARIQTTLLTENIYPNTYHLQATRRLSTQWSTYARWDNLYWDRHDRSGGDWAALTGEEKYANFAHDYTFGVRFDFRSDMMISGEYHYIEGTSWLSPYDNPNQFSTAKYWNMVALEFSYRF